MPVAGGFGRPVREVLHAVRSAQRGSEFLTTASVDQNGRVTANSAGTAVITAASADDKPAGFFATLRAKIVAFFKMIGDFYRRIFSIR